VVAVGLREGVEDLLQGTGSAGEFVAQVVEVLRALVAVIAQQIAQGSAAFQHGG
jgi:hypothetical protein